MSLERNETVDHLLAGFTPRAPTPARAITPLDTLRTITRQMATVEDLQVVLRSITTTLVDQAAAVIARVFLLMTDHDCPHCRERIARGEQQASDEIALHMVALAGSNLDSPPPEFHRQPLDSQLPAAVLLRSRTPMLIQDWRNTPMAQDPLISKLWAALGIVGLAGYPLEFRGEPLGVMGYLAGRRVEAHEFEVLGIFAEQAAMAIKNAYLFRERERYKNRLQVENAYLQNEIRTDRGFDDIVGQSPALQGVLRKVRQVASAETTVLLTGETGTGKELIARAIHESSPRKDRAMIKVNCGAIPQGVVESELFGHEKGAFTGAIQKRIGRFELADKGTLFMDEVGELPLDTQVKLLRVLQEREFERVGNTSAIKVDVRLIAATNRDLDREVKEGRFRPDLFYRLNVFPIRIPPLRERAGDIPMLVDHFLAQFQRKMCKPLKSVTKSSLEQMQRYSWPGNIRELQNVLERACVLARGPEVELASPLRSPPAASTTSAPDAGIPTLADYERAQIRRALAAVNGRVHGPSGAAALLGVNPSTLRSRMQKLGIGKS
ncbi:MAG TPA: sigma 54-interacting transcriptional regulator [Gemmatimonadaceae bacterium]|nr:sigma 54-interacting transcriptional regulator [Gemmatimonadaceae bacterium]